MRIFQVGNIYQAHLNDLGSALAETKSYKEAYEVILSDVPQAQILQGCIKGQHGSRLCFPQYGRGLAMWASEHGMDVDTRHEDILLAMIEEVGAEVFYSVNATFHSEEFMKRLPSCVRLKVGWLGSRNVGGALNHFDIIVSNFPTLNARHSADGLSTQYFAPSYETLADSVDSAEWMDREVDLFFAGTFSRHHTRRSDFLEKVCKKKVENTLEADIRLLSSRFTNLVENTPLGFIPPFRDLRRPNSIRAVAKRPVFGQEMMARMAQARMVINMAIDIAGSDRGNMRCFEALSCGALLVSDAGEYPEGFVDGETHVTYQTPEGALEIIDHFINNPNEGSQIAKAGNRMIRERYSKLSQWAHFEGLCSF